jgi:deoxyribodipyrimidine photo-lyase
MTLTAFQGQTRLFDDARPTAQRAVALERVNEFARSAARQYAARRNFDLGPDDRGNVSMLSPYISRRLILEEEVIASILQYQSLDGSEKFIQEVFWRTYFKGWLEHRPAVWFAYAASVRRLVRQLDDDADLKQRYGDAVMGRTGIDCFDHWVRELRRTGYLHNHARMWFASIWVFTLRLPWPLGADFFLRHLLDGDAASNTLGWRWVAGLHTRGKTYLARASNIARYTDGRFNPEGQLAAEAPPLEEAPLPDAIDIDSYDQVPVGTRYGLLLSEEDCCAETLDLPQAPSAVLALNAASARSPLGVSGQVRDFSEEALRDGLQRLQVAWGVTGDQLDCADWGPVLTAWAQSSDLDLIVTAAPCQGPVNDVLALAELALAAAGVRLLRVRRDYDLRAWPYTSKGYFALRKKIPSLLKAMDLGERW